MSAPVVITYAGAKYVSLDALRAGCADPLLIANAVTLLKVGVEKGESLARAISIASASFVGAVAGEFEPVPFTAEQLAKLSPIVDRPAMVVAAEIAERKSPGRN